MTRLFAGGVIPRSNAAQIEFSRNELPPLGTVGRGQVHDALPEVAEFSEWVRQRRSGVTFQTILALRRARPEIDRAHAAGVEHARSGIVRIAEGQYQIPIVIRADRFGCNWQVEASFVSVVYGCVLRALGNPRDPAFLEFLLYTQFDAGPFDYYQPPTEVTGSTTTGRSTSRPLDDRGTRLAHRFTWLMARRGRHVTWDDWEVTRRLRRPPASPVQLANMDAVVRQGFNVGLETFALVPSSIRSVLPPEGLSVPPLLSLKFFGVTFARGQRAEFVIPPADDQSIRAREERAPLWRWEFVVATEYAAAVLRGVAEESYHNQRIPVYPIRAVLFVMAHVSAGMRDLVMFEGAERARPVRHILEDLLIGAHADPGEHFFVQHSLASQRTRYVRQELADAVRSGEVTMD